MPRRSRPPGNRRRAGRADRPDPPPTGGRAATAGGIITAITPQRRRPQRISIYIDDRFCLSADAEVVLRLGLAPGQAIDAAGIGKIAELDAQLRARTGALGYLAASARTRAEVERYLRRRGFAPAAITACLDFLTQRGYIDDRALAEQHVAAATERGIGRERLRHELQQRGVDEATITAALQGLADDAVAAARTVLRARLQQLGALEPAAAYRRLSGYLLRRGFSWEEVEAALTAELGPLDAPD